MFIQYKRQVDFSPNIIDANLGYDGLITYAKCKGVIPTNINKFQEGCLIAKIDAVNNSTEIYYNSGVPLAPIWTPIGGGSSAWGSITGTLSSQTDLQNALDAKLATVTTDATMTGAGTVASPLSVVATSASDVAITVRAATTAALAGTWTYNNGTAGVGATLTRTTNGALPNQDGVSLMDGDRFLIKNQASTLANGVYVLTQKGVASVSPTIFTRATDADETSELDELVVTISEGSTNRGTVWGQQTNNPVVGTSAIVFATVVSTAVTQATSGTQAINQIPLYTGTARQLTRGTANFKYNPTNDLFTIRGIDYTFPANNGDVSQVLTTDGSGNLSWTSGAGGGTPAGSDTQIQYNNAGAFGADAGFFKTDETFGLGLLQTQQSAVTFTGSGLDDLTVAGTFTGTVPTTYTVTVASTGTPDTFDWTDGN
jgi:hypothetical protein